MDEAFMLFLPLFIVLGAGGTLVMTVATMYFIEAMR
jgi:hypothetical protein